MTELLTAAQMRAIEQAAIASGEVTGLELMERAGRGVVEAIFEEWPELAKTSHRAVVLCGPGNNGGDGFVVARLLKEWGWEVEVFLYGDPEKLPPDARVNYQRWTALGRASYLDLETIEPVLSADWDLSVDALFGVGMSRPLQGKVWHELLHFLLDRNAHGRKPSVAIDVPTGLHSDTGARLGGVFPAALTVTFHRPKLGHFLGRATIECGKLVVRDIGLGKRWLREAAVLLDRNAPGISFLAKGHDEHKYSHGHALILSGPPGRGGAARLAARGALRIGAGLVTLACPPEAIPENAARLDAVMLRPLADAGGLAGLLEDDRINALCLGPGLGTGPREAALLAAALGVQTAAAPGLTRGPEPLSAPPENRGPGSSPGRRGEHPAVVFDADAITLLSQHPDLLGALHEGCILTPHEGEFARLFPDLSEKLNAPASKGPAYSKVDATREAAARAGCIILFKGPDTVIADAQGRAAINSAHYDRAAPWLATAGSGDVLAGMIAGLLARGFPPMQAAETAAWLHVECALSFGPGLIAEDIPEELPKVFRSLGL